MVEDARRRMQAILAVFDDDLEKLEEILLPAMAEVVLPPEQWKTALVARATVEESLRSLEDSANETVKQSSDWKRRAEIAEREGRMDMERQARMRADTAWMESRIYLAEAEAVRDFLRQWDARVKPAD